MAVKIRLSRIGAKKRPFYRIVVVDERKKRTGAYLELVGTYNPLTEPHEIILKQDRIDYWLKNGAVPSVGYLRIIGKAPQRLPRKPKKQSASTAAETPVSPVAKNPAPQAESTQPVEAQVTENKAEPASETARDETGTTATTEESEKTETTEVSTEKPEPQAE